jgi:inhibitor of cysteine peptidase
MRKPLLFAVILAVASIVCSASKPLIISEGSNGKTLTVARDTSFTIALKGNASTGFSWNIRELDTTRLCTSGQGRFIGRDTIPGTSGTFYLDFIPVKKGVSTIRLVYSREWETDIPPEDSFSVTISVR